MRTYILAIATAALFALPTSAFSQVDIEIGPGGVRVGPGTSPLRRWTMTIVRRRTVSRVAASLPPQGRARRARHGQLPQISRNVPLVQEANSGTPGRNSSGFFLSATISSNRDTLNLSGALIEMANATH